MIGAGFVADHFHGAMIHALRSGLVVIAQRRAHERGQRNDDVRVLEQGPHHFRIATVTAHDVKGLVLAAICQTILAKHKVVQHGNLVAEPEQVGGHDGAEIAGPAGDEDVHNRLVEFELVDDFAADGQ